MDTALDILKQARDWVDSFGTKGWIAAMILGFIFAGPLGLVILFYAIGTGRMGKCKKNWRNYGRGFATSGNGAFDSYRNETLKRLEDEQTAFRKFMGNLRAAKDKAEFDQFMDNRESRGFDAPDEPSAAPRDPGFGATPNPA